MALTDDMYVRADISGYETEITEIIAQFVDSLKGETVELQRRNLPKIVFLVQDCVDYCMARLPETLDRVDGYSIKPLLVSIVKNLVSGLPMPENEGV